MGLPPKTSRALDWMSDLADAREELYTAEDAQGRSEDAEYEKQSEGDS